MTSRRHGRVLGLITFGMLAVSNGDTGARGFQRSRPIRHTTSYVSKLRGGISSRIGWRGEMFVGGGRHVSMQRNELRKLCGAEQAPTMTRQQATTIDREHTKLHFMEIGCGELVEEKDPVIILHGLLGNSMNFNSWAKDLNRRLQSSRRIIIPDLRNHGQSPHTSSMHYEDMINDVLALMDREHISSAEFIGHSMGGKVAAGLALRYPHRVNALAVLDIAPVSYSEDSSWWHVDSVITAMTQIPVESLTTRDQADIILKQTISDPVLRAFALTNLVKDREKNGLRWRINVKTIHKSLANIRDFEIGLRPGEKRSFSRDVFFISGRRSKYISTRHLSTISDLFPKYRMVTIKDAGHWVHAEYPAETAQYCQMFLDRDT
ncbi:hypothetical protein AAMO2058_001136100 [Amorphochlora amoebiformis]